MQRTIHVLAGIGAAIAAAACGDSVPPTPVAVGDAAVGSPGAAAHARAKPGVSAAEFHARNRMDWVGVAHNKAMDDLRDDIRKLKPKDLCKAVEKVAVDGPQDVRVGAGLSAAELRKLRRSVFEATGCRGKQSGVRNASNALRAGADLQLVAGTWPVFEEFALSSDAWALIGRITDAGGSAPSPNALAGELAAITAEAAALPADEQAVVEAMASVSLSSLEYWEQNSQAMQQEAESVYGACVAGGGGQGCYYASSRTGIAPRAQPVFQLASAHPGAEVCAIDKGLIWSGDKWGAGVGLTIGLLTRSVQGAIAGLVGGAVAGSAGAATYEFARYVYCAYHQ